MARVITFSRFFPSYHPRKGEPTFFIERLWKGLHTGNRLDGEYSVWTNRPRLMKAGYWQLPHMWRDKMNDKEFLPKYHTMRSGNRWKVGDKFSPRIWSGIPRRSKQITVGPDIEIKKIWDVEFDIGGVISINGFYTEIEDEVFANNDGLSIEDFYGWFPQGKEFKGQIICWNEKIEY